MPIIVGKDEAASANNQSSTQTTNNCNPEIEVEVVYLSAGSLLTNNRFVCDVCNKGFQRDQNLQLHRRRHNLPWKLKKKSSNEEVMKKRIYVCPEPDCIHHDSTRALGDLSALKKHFNRKHGEKKFKCERCSNKYGLLSDLKVHIKTCAIKQYTCACALIFTRRDSLMVHRALCETLTTELNNEENVVVVTTNSEGKEEMQEKGKSSSSLLLTPLTGLVSPISSTDTCGANFSSSACVDASIHVPSISTFQYPALVASDPYPVDPMTISLASSPYVSSYVTPSYPVPSHQHYTHYSSNQLPSGSETALLQKAAHIGPTASGVSTLQNLGFSGSVPFNPQNENETLITGFNDPPPLLWNNHTELGNISVDSGLEMRIHTNASLSPNNFLQDSLAFFPNNIGSDDFMMFDDLHGLRIGAPEEAFTSDGSSSFLGSMGGQFGVGVSSLVCGMDSGGSTWGVPANNKRPLE